MKILKINNCAICPNKLWAGNVRVCSANNYKVIDVPVTDIPDWCPLEDVSIGSFEMMVKLAKDQKDMPLEFNKVVDKMLDETS